MEVRITWLHANCRFQDRMENWEELRVIGRSVKSTWLVVGDFNEISCEAEKGGGRAKARGNMDSFNQLMCDLALQDASYQVQRFIWCNNRDGNGRVKERLDRALVNTLWIDVFPKALILVEPAVGSDNSPFILETEWKEFKGPSIF